MLKLPIEVVLHNLLPNLSIGTLESFHEAYPELHSLIDKFCDAHYGEIFRDPVKVEGRGFAKFVRRHHAKLVTWGIAEQWRDWKLADNLISMSRGSVADAAPIVRDDDEDYDFCDVESYELFTPQRVDVDIPSVSGFPVAEAAVFETTRGTYYQLDTRTGELHESHTRKPILCDQFASMEPQYEDCAKYQFESGQYAKQDMRDRRGWRFLLTEDGALVKTHRTSCNKTLLGGVATYTVKSYEPVLSGLDEPIEDMQRVRGSTFLGWTGLILRTATSLYFLLLSNPSAEIVVPQNALPIVDVVTKAQVYRISTPAPVSRFVSCNFSFQVTGDDGNIELYSDACATEKCLSGGGLCLTDDGHVYYLDVTTLEFTKFGLENIVDVIAANNSFWALAGDGSLYAGGTADHGILGIGKRIPHQKLSGDVDQSAAKCFTSPVVEESTQEIASNKVPFVAIPQRMNIENVVAICLHQGQTLFALTV